jgi:hypothetical protein
MRIIIAGDRHFTNKQYIYAVIAKAGFPITEVVSGGAKGVDTIGEMYALEHGIPLKRFPVNWNVYGKAAGPIRNQQMANYADGLIAFLAPGSKGTKNMIETATKKGLPVKVCDITKPVNYRSSVWDRVSHQSHIDDMELKRKRIKKAKPIVKRCGCK